MQSKAKTVADYLAQLPADRRAALTAIRTVIRANIDPEYQEGMGYGMMGWSVPHRVFPPGYHCDPKQPLPFAGLASQKHYMSLYLMSVYDGGDEAKWLRAAWTKAGKKLDMGKCCIRFKKLEDVPLEVVGEAFRRMPARAWVAHYESLLDPRTGKPRSSRPAKARATEKTPRPGKKAIEKDVKKAGQKAAKPRTAAARPARRTR